MNLSFTNIDTDFRVHNSNRLLHVVAFNALTNNNNFGKTQSPDSPKRHAA